MEIRQPRCIIMAESALNIGTTSFTLSPTWFPARKTIDADVNLKWQPRARYGTFVNVFRVIYLSIIAIVLTAERAVPGE